MITSGAIDMFTHVLNEAEKFRSENTPARLFCHTAMVTSEMDKWEYDDALDKFSENMELVVQRSEYFSLHGVDLVFFPMILGSHFIIICMKLKYKVIGYLNNIFSSETDPYKRYGPLSLLLVSLFEDYLVHENNPCYSKMASAEKRILSLGCRTCANYVDCGVL